MKTKKDPSYPKILLLSELYDFPSDRICGLLLKQEVPFLRLNSADLKEYKVTMNPREASVTLENGSHHYALNNNTIKSIFFRQPIYLRNISNASNSLTQQLEISQWMAFIRGLSILSNPKWVNNPKDIYLAESKPLQLKIASEIGLKVPKTIIANHHSSYPTNEDKFIVKSVDSVILKKDNTSYFTYSTVISKQDYKESELANAPVILQENIEHKKIDIRVTLFDQKIFAYEILSDKPIIGDWRPIEKPKLRYLKTELPKSLTNKLIALNKKLNLTYSTIDLIKSNDKYYFLEVNPTGEWGFLDSDNMISDWIARQLIKGHEVRCARTALPKICKFLTMILDKLNDVWFCVTCDYLFPPKTKIKKIHNNSFYAQNNIKEKDLDKLDAKELGDSIKNHNNLIEKMNESIWQLNAMFFTLIGFNITIFGFTVGPQENFMVDKVPIMILTFLIIFFSLIHYWNTRLFYGVRKMRGVGLSYEITLKNEDRDELISDLDNTVKQHIFLIGHKHYAVNNIKRIAIISLLIMFINLCVYLSNLFL